MTSANERIRRGDGELVAREPATPPVAPGEVPAPSGHQRAPLPPPPPIRLRPPTSWLRAR